MHQHMSGRARASTVAVGVALAVLAIACSPPEPGPAPTTTSSTTTSTVFTAPPTGEIYLFQLSDGKLKAVDAATGAVRTVHDSSSGPCCPQGTPPRATADGRIAFTSYEGSFTHEIQLVNHDGTGFGPFTDTQPGGDIFQNNLAANPVVSDEFLMSSTSGLAYRTAGDNFSVVPGTDQYDGYPDYDPTGARIVFTHCENLQGCNTAEAPTVRVANHDGTGQQNLGIGMSPRWSPDGSRVAFSACGDYAFCDNQPISGIWVMGADGSDRHQIVSDICSDSARPAWSPDGEWLVYLRCEVLPNGSTQNYSLRLVRPDGTDDHVLVDDGTYGAGFAWVA